MTVQKADWTKMPVSLNIAFTYDSKDHVRSLGFTDEQASSFASQLLVSGVEGGLRSLGHRVINVGHIGNLAKRLVAGESEDWDLVFNVCEGVYGKAKEVQVPALLDAYRIPYTFFDAACLAVGSDKVKTKIILQHHNIPTLPFILLPAYEEMYPAKPYSISDWTVILQDRLMNSNLEVSAVQPLFLKPTLEGGSNGIDRLSRSTSLEDLAHATMTLRQRLPRQDLMIEQFADGREFTVTIIGTEDQARVLGILEYLQPSHASGMANGWTPAAANNVDFRTSEIKNKEQASTETTNVTHEDSDEVREAQRIALDAFKALGCRDLSRVDVRSIGTGKPAKPQVNCIPGLRPGTSPAALTAQEEGWTYEQLLDDILRQAMRRVGN